jgi:hypothetical protein
MQASFGILLDQTERRRKAKKIEKLFGNDNSSMLASIRRIMLNDIGCLEITRRVTTCSSKPIQRIGLVSIRRIDLMPMRRIGVGFKGEPPRNFLDFL